VRISSLVALGLLAAAPAAAQAAGGRPGAAGPAAGAKRDTTVKLDTGSVQLVREVFSYEGAGRDPFISLLKSGDVRPLITDLKLVTIVYDARYPGRSVAVLRDITNGKRYRAKAGEVFGRLRVTQIRPREVVFTVQEYGYERQVTLSLAKQEGTP
jgi:hypothetical protein